MADIIEIQGVSEALRFLRAKGKDIRTATEVGLLQASVFVQEKLKRSIQGHEAEPRSVDTGRFGNSIKVDKVNSEEFIVFPEKSFYPGTSTTTADVARALEFGTSRNAPRSHFRNTTARTKSKVRDIIESAIKKI